MSWQWVELYVDLSALGPLVQRTVEISLFARGNTGTSRNGRVFFDNVCLEAFHGMIQIMSVLHYKVDDAYANM